MLIRVGVAIVDRRLNTAVDALIARTSVFSPAGWDPAGDAPPDADVVIAQPELVSSCLGDRVAAWRDRGCELVAVFDGPLDPALPSAVRGHVRGLVDRHDQVDDYGRAISVLAGGGGWVSPWLAPWVLDLATAGLDRTPDMLTGLSRREREVLALLGEGASNLDIALAMGIGYYTVKGHVSSLLRKLDARNRGQLTALFQRMRSVTN